MNHVEHINERKHRKMVEKAQRCVDSHVKQAMAASFIPLVSLPVVYGICAKMIVKLDKIFGIPTAKGWDSEIVQDLMVGVVAAPALLIPVLGAGVAAAYVKSIGENYAKAVATVVGASAPQELSDSRFVARQVKEELRKIRAPQRDKQLARPKNRGSNSYE
ncbi:MAG: hypothetical protein FWC76_07650 [Defluviitaleaceae bacterium]|nr:hypothetical protein [Defluviitaleaceae bacterium]